MSTLIHYLKRDGRSAGDAKRLLQAGKVYVEDVPTADGGQSIEGKRIKIISNAPKLTPGRDLFILYKDPHVAVVCKPAGCCPYQQERKGDTKMY